MFKKGDRVKYIGDLMSKHTDKEGTVVEDYNGPSHGSVRISLDDGSHDPYYNGEIGAYPHNVKLLVSAEPKLPTGFDDDRHIVDIARSLVYGDRNADYGHPADDYAKNAAFAQIIFKDKLKDDAVLTPQDLVLFMICLKVSRLINDPLKRDSIVDVAGYAECFDRINRRELGLE